MQLAKKTSPCCAFTGISSIDFILNIKDTFFFTLNVVYVGINEDLMKKSRNL